MTHHSLLIFDRGAVHVHRWRATCSCGWVAVNRRRKVDAVKLHRSHVNGLISARRRPSVPRPCTPVDCLPDLLRAGA